MSEPVSAVGLVGLGNMGLPMAGRLQAAGFRVVAHDAAEAARDRAEAAGIETAELGDVASGTALVILMLPGSDAVASVLADPALRDRLEPGSLVVDMSSSEPMRTRALARELLVGSVHLVDAPVSGGVAGATAGTLTIMLGGEADEAAHAMPFLESMGRVVHAGPVGAGHAVKALNNLLSATHLWATSEAMLAGQRFGLDPEVMLSIFNRSSGRSGSTENKWPNYILPGTFDSGFELHLMLKDMRIGVRLIEATGVPDPLSAQAVELWERAAVGLPAAADHTEVAAWLRDRSEVRS
ncbi:MAG: NAD(P)-dependent oxidoreductase [Acidimicrobiales bacterium]